MSGDTALRFPLIPKVAVPSVFRFESGEGRARRSPAWYLAHPTPMVSLTGASSPTVHMWFCFAGPRRVVETIEPAYPWMPRRTFVVDFCGAPPGIRCSCGTQRENHDPGDEDAHP